MNRPPVVSAEQWQVARDALLVKEKALTRELDALAAERRRLPMVQIDAGYVFDGPDGKVTLPDLFDGRSQLVIYHFMFGPDAEAPCPGCTNYTDGVPDHLERLHAGGITYVNVSRAPLARIEAMRADRGWTMPWFSSAESTFNEDLGLLPGGHDMFALSAWLRDGDDVFRTYFLQHGPMVQSIGSIWSMWSLTPYGGQSEDEDAPEDWPRAPQSFWFRRHDEFDELPPSACDNGNVANQDDSSGQT